MEIWAKTLLSVYKYLDKIAGALDELIRKKCIYSSFASNRQDIFSQTDGVISLMNRKIHIINLKVITEQALAGLKLSDRKIIMLSYVDGVKCKDVANILKMPMRTYFRAKSKAVNSFANALIRLGYTDAKLQEKYGSEHWLNKVYASAKENKEVTQYTTSSFLQDVLSEFGKIKGHYYNYV